MADVYVYRFTGWDGPSQPKLKGRRATLETIRDIGDPIMESQIVVDDPTASSAAAWRMTRIPRRIWRMKFIR
jgi:hypothetical protein